MSSAPEMPVRPGDVLAGKYRVERVLGHGGMGVVVAATQLDLGRLVALKFLLHAVTQADVVARFLREARIVGGLHSEHVARVYELGQLENGVHYMAMEYLDGADVAALLVHRGPFHFAEAAAVVRQACEAIAEAHQSGVVHRDLKPANLFSTRRPNGAHLIKVLDFGISKTSTAADHSMTRTSALMGSPYYMSPEQMARPKTVDFRTDIWSLGVILHELVTGKVPFQGETLAELALNVHHEQPPPIASLRSDVPPAYQAIVTRCLQKDRELRYGSIRELSDALKAFEGSLTNHGAVAAPASEVSAAPAAFEAGTPARAAFEGAVTGVAPQEASAEAGRTGNWGGTIARPRRSGVLVAIVASAIVVAALGTTAAFLLQRSRSAESAPGAAESVVAPSAHGVTPPSSFPTATSAVSSPPASAGSSVVTSPAASALAVVPPTVSVALPSARAASATAAPRLRAAPPPSRAGSSPRASAGSKPSPSSPAMSQHPPGWEDEILRP